MNEQMHEIMQQRAQLVARIAAQREQVAVEMTRWSAPLAAVDRGLVAGQYLRSHPLVLVGVAGVVALVAVKRRSVMVIVGGALRLWSLYKTAKSFSAKLGFRI